MSLTLFGARPTSSILAQFAESTSLPPSDSELPTATWRGRRFTLDSLVSKKGSRGRTSWIRDHGTFVTELVGSTNTLGESFWICRRCDERREELTLFRASATTSATGHLRKKHRIFEGSSEECSSTSSSDTPPTRPSQLRPLAISKNRTNTLEELALGFIITTNQAFDVFGNPFLRQLIQSLNPDIFESLLWGRTSMRTKLDVLFIQKKKQIQAELRYSTSNIHIAYDHWTSPNRLAILAVSAHFINQAGKQQQRLLSLREQTNAHTGRNTANILLEIIRDWDLTDRLGVLISDNASTNDTCGEELFQSLNPSLSPEDAIERRIRCFGHILNLVGRAFLYGEDSEAFEQESQLLEEVEDPDDILRHWRKKGPIGKLHNIVRWVRSSPQRSEYFKRLTAEEDLSKEEILLHQQSPKELQLILNNETRWNSTYLTIERALRKKSDIQYFLAKNQLEADPYKQIPSADHLSIEDWRLLIEIQTAIEPLYRQTMRIQGWAKQGSHGALWEILVGMEFILERMEDWKAFFDDPNQNSQQQISYSQQVPPRRGLRLRNQRPKSLRSSQALPEYIRPEYTEVPRRLEALSEDSRQYFRLSITNAWQKLNEYYTKLGESPLYTAAVILHPGLGIRWLEAQWANPEQLAWVHEAREGVYQWWDRWYRQSPPSGALSPSQEPGDFEILRSLRATAPTTSFDDWIRSRRQRIPTADSELDVYLRLDLSEAPDIKDPVAWWIGQRENYPTVSKFALDIFAVPAMSADCERAFSLSKLTLTSQRMGMAPETLEKLQCINNWLRRGAVTLGEQYFGLQSGQGAQHHEI